MKSCNVFAACAAVIVGLVAAGNSDAQPGPQRPAFEVASIKRNKDCQTVSGPGISPGRVSLSCLPIRTLVRAAYGTAPGGSLMTSRVDVLGGPSWLDSNRYDIVATMADKTSVADLVPMLQTLLEERCKLTVHKEARDSPVYALVLDNGAVKPSPTKDLTCIPMDLSTHRGEPPKPGDPAPRYCGYGGPKVSEPGVMILDLHAFTMAEFAGKILRGLVDRPVVEKTGLTGRFDLHIEFDISALGPAQGGGGAAAPVPVSEKTAPSIFTAVRAQLGLRLLPVSAPAEVVVIDHVEVPSEN